MSDQLTQPTLAALLMIISRLRCDDYGVGVDYGMVHARYVREAREG